MATTSNPVLTMLKADHKKVKAMFAEYKDATPRKQQEIAQTAIEEMEIHAGLEEGLVYPAIRKGTRNDDLMNEANEEHHLVHVLIAELKELEPSDEAFKAKFTVLGELVKHHVKEEEGEMFPQAQKAKIDWEALEDEVMERKEQLMAQV
ncbi:MAG: hemerythrin domain-containing protein [Nitrospira sp.]|nr:hemerythrin domain-containing protein [Nitrospira sp.]